MPSPSFTTRLLTWYQKNRRDLPWRAPKNTSTLPDPYHVLVSESMLQQTQVATVIPYFHRFLARFPTLADLAAAPEQDVLRQWQGLGYYSRARNLQKAAQQIVKDFAGQIPHSVDQLLTLPGVGRYTAGAIASIAFNQRAPILDGNVIRVLARQNAIRQDPATPAVREILWTAATDILPKKHLSEFNSALMELGALICTPRTPPCLLCPVQQHCQAYAAGLQEKIPAPKPTKINPLEHRWTFGIFGDGKFLIEQRPSTGRWASMWQFLTIPASPATKPAAALLAQKDLHALDAQPIATIHHALTHRRYRFDVFFVRLCRKPKLRKDQPYRWAALAELDAYPLPRPHLHIAKLLSNACAVPVATTPAAAQA